MKVWWFKLQGLSEEAVGEPNTHSACTAVEPEAYHERARRALHAHCGRTRHAPRAHQIGIARAPDLGGADEG